MVRIVHTRDKLYEEVWVEPVIKVAERYGVSGVALAKTCRKLSVPLPPRGYWAKVHAGKTPKRPPLPKLKKGQPDRVIGHRWPKPEPPTRPPEFDAVVPVPVDAGLSVDEVLTDPHPLVERTRHHLIDVKPIKGLLPTTNKPCLDISVSPDSLDRALRIADALLKTMEAAGLKVEERIVKPRGKRPPRRTIWDPVLPGEPEQRITHVLCDDEWITFGLSERVKRVKDPEPEVAPKRGWDGTYYTPYTPATHSYVPTGELTLTIADAERLPVRTTWKDGKRKRIEADLAEFVAGLSTVAMAMKLDREETERRRLAAIEAEKRQWARQRREWAEKEREKTLLAEVERWRLAEDIRDYVRHTARLFGDAVPPAKMSLLWRWRLGWALRYAAEVDPLTPLRKELQHPPTGEDAHGTGDPEDPSAPTSD